MGNGTLYVSSLGWDKVKAAGCRWSEIILSRYSFCRFLLLRLRDIAHSTWDARFFHGDFGVTFDWYQRDTRNMIVPGFGHCLYIQCSQFPKATTVL